MSIHSSSLQFISAAFNAQLGGERGMVVVDSQTYQHNHRLAHSMFTQRFAKKPNNTNLLDMPVFGHSDSHAGLQIADLLSSAVLEPIASAVYAGSYSTWNRHCHSSYLDIREEFGERLEALTFEWRNPRTARASSSIVVRDPINKRASRLMWSPARNPRAKTISLPRAQKTDQRQRDERERRGRRAYRRHDHPWTRLGSNRSQKAVMYPRAAGRR